MKTRNRKSNDETAARASRAFAAALALATMALASGQAQALCNAGQRIDHSEAECLETTIEQATKAGKPWFSITTRNACDDLGDVTGAFLSELPGGQGQWLETMNHTDGNAQTQSGHGRLLGAWCCTEDGDLCERSDIVNAESCKTRFETSGASESCVIVDITVQGAPRAEECAVESWCNDDAGQLTSDTLSVPWAKMTDLVNCDGHLRESCS